MRTSSTRQRRSGVELGVWASLAVAGGLIAGWADANATDAQGPALVLALAAFAVTLPGRASAWWVTLLVGSGIPIAALARGDAFNPGWIIAFVPAAFGAFGGVAAGRLLERGLAFADPASDAATMIDTASRRRTAVACALLVVTAMGAPLVRAVLHDAGHPLAAWVALIWQILTLLGWLIVAPLVIWVERELQLAVDVRGIVVRAFAVLGLAAAHGVVIALLTGALLIPSGGGIGSLVEAAALTYLPLDALVYLGVVSIGMTFDASRAARAARERESAERLAALRARLNPHFLFNALNGASVLARAGRADETSRVIGGITELLRYVLDERRAVVPLADEVAFVEQYLDVQRVRFGERLRARIDVEPGLERAAVPQLVLQPIVENAIEHGVAASLDGTTVSIAASRADDTLTLAVDDDGPGFAPDDVRTGIGLSHTRERLARVFGARASLSVERRGERGTRVVIRLPFEPAPVA